MKTVTVSVGVVLTPHGTPTVDAGGSARGRATAQR
jgi:hypothetical protein